MIYEVSQPGGDAISATASHTAVAPAELERTAAPSGRTEPLAHATVRFDSVVPL
jgi:hypothetical protein